MGLGTLRSLPLNLNLNLKLTPTNLSAQIRLAENPNGTRHAGDKFSSPGDHETETAAPNFPPGRRHEARTSKA